MVWTILGSVGLLLLAVAAFLAFGLAAGVAALGVALLLAGIDGRRP
jgi:hypothetical protein